MQTSYRFLRGCALILILALPLAAPSQVLANDVKDLDVLVGGWTLATRYNANAEIATLVITDTKVIVRFSLDRLQTQCEVEVSEFDVETGIETVVYRDASSPCVDDLIAIMAPVKEYLGVDGVRFIPLIARYIILVNHQFEGKEQKFEDKEPIFGDKEPIFGEKEPMDPQDRDDMSIDLGKAI